MISNIDKVPSRPLCLNPLRPLINVEVILDDLIGEVTYAALPNTRPLSPPPYPTLRILT